MKNQNSVGNLTNFPNVLNALFYTFLTILRFLKSACQLIAICEMYLVKNFEALIFISFP